MQDKALDKRIVTALVAVAGAALLCPAAAQAVIIPFVADLDSSQEVPAGNGSFAFGTGVFELDTDTNIFNWQILYTGALLLGPETAAHIHGPAPAGVNAGVIIPLALGEFKSDSVDLDGIAAADVDDLMNRLWYVNIHTTVNPGGEIRGQILPASAVPEPGTLVMLAAFGAVVLSRRRRA